jgi:outer membrane lipoprotein-sorting protein
MRSSLMASVACILLTLSPAAAAPPGAQTLAQRMKAALEPDRSSLRTIITILHSGGETVEWTARQARKRLADGNRLLTVLLEPADVKGIALLIWEHKNQAADAQWLYLPALRRVRQILPLGTFESFLGTDFTTSDLGFIDLRHRTFSLLGRDKIGDTQVYRIQEVLKDPRYYSRIVTWIAIDSMLPLRRDYYDVANRLWKTETFEDVKTIDGVPTPLRIVMEDKQEGSSTEFKVRQVRYDVQIPDDLFDPLRLPMVVNHPVWAPSSP